MTFPRYTNAFLVRQIIVTVLLYMIFVYALAAHPARAEIMRWPSFFSSFVRQPVQRGSSVLVEARHWLGSGNPTGTRGPWCRDFVNFVLRRTGHHYNPSRLAITSVALGPRIRSPRPGSIAVMRSHVGFVEAVEPGGILLISGNHRHKVGEGLYNPRRILAYVEPE